MGKSRQRAFFTAKINNMDKISLNELAKNIHSDNVARGFYDEKHENGTYLMLVVSELSEAIEADRKNRHARLDAYMCNPTPDNFKIHVKESYEDEITDAIIRLFDHVGLLGIDIEKHIEAKLAYNRTRGYKHGKKY